MTAVGGGVNRESVGLFAHSEWQSDALCHRAVREQGFDPNWWHDATSGPSPSITTRLSARKGDLGRNHRVMAMRVCAMCPVSEVCLSWATERKLLGLWGGRWLVAKRSG